MKTIYVVSVMLSLGTLICSGAPFSNEPGGRTQAIVVSTSDSLMKTVLENNRHLRVAWESYQVAVLEAGTGNTPPDPEVQLGYLYGNPSELGNRVDFSVTQQVDFPTAYIHKSRVRKIKTTQAELAYIVSRQEVLLQAKQLWIERVHFNQKEGLLKARLEQARKINDHYQIKMELGEVGQVAFSQSNLHLTAIQGEYDQVLSDIEVNQLAILEIAGGDEVQIPDSSLPSPVGFIPDTLLKAYLSGPELQLYNRELELKEEAKSVTVSQNLPKLTAGYYSESVLDVKFKGFQVGVTVPLWENSNRIKHAKTEIIHAEANIDRFKYLQNKELLQKINQLESLTKRTQLLEEALGTGNSMELLALALEGGEISLSEYFYASDFYFQNQQLLLRYRKDQLMLEADLLKVYL